MIFSGPKTSYSNGKSTLKKKKKKERNFKNICILKRIYSRLCCKETSSHGKKNHVLCLSVFWALSPLPYHYKVLNKGLLLIYKWNNHSRKGQPIPSEMEQIYHHSELFAGRMLFTWQLQVVAIWVFVNLYHESRLKLSRV